MIKGYLASPLFAKDLSRNNQRSAATGLEAKQWGSEILRRIRQTTEGPPLRNLGRASFCRGSFLRFGPKAGIILFRAVAENQPGK